MFVKNHDEGKKKFPNLQIGSPTIRKSRNKNSNVKPRILWTSWTAQLGWWLNWARIYFTRYLANPTWKPDDILGSYKVDPGNSIFGVIFVIWHPMFVIWHLALYMDILGCTGTSFVHRIQIRHPQIYMTLTKGSHFSNRVILQNCGNSSILYRTVFIFSCHTKSTRAFDFWGHFCNMTPHVCNMTPCTV